MHGWSQTLHLLRNTRCTIMYEIEDVIKKRDWKFLVKNFLPVNFVDIFTFSEVMYLVGHLIKAAEDEIERDGFIADVFRDFAVNLMIILRAKNPKEWGIDWKNEAFLGIACASVYPEEEAFTYIKNAYQQVKNPPQSLIFAFISAGNRYPSALTKQEISQLIQQASEKETTYESAERMAILAREMQQKKKYEYWKKKANELERKKIHTPIITPDVLKPIFDLHEGFQHEK